jgi:drug/metabolite transporter (DMT)-like permease
MAGMPPVRHCLRAGPQYNGQPPVAALAAPPPIRAPVPDQRHDLTATLMLVALNFAWGFTWPAMRIALVEIPPFSMRVVSLGLGVVSLLAVVKLQGRRFALGGVRDWLHVVVAGLLNIVGFTMLSSFALLLAATSRVAMLSYTMPIWAALFAWLALGERFTAARILALVLCGTGLAIVIYPLAQAGIPAGLLLAVAAGMSWAAGTVYLKWARISGDTVAVAAWQVVVAFVFVVACLPLVEGSLHLSHASAPALFGTIFTGLIGSGLAYFLWFKIIGRLPAMTASLGILSAPVIGVVSTAIMLGELPTVPDMIGFALIFAASVCVLLPSRGA